MKQLMHLLIIFSFILHNLGQFWRPLGPPAIAYVSTGSAIIAFASYVMFFLFIVCDQSSNSEFMNKSDEFVIASKDNVAFAQSVLFQGEFYIWRRLLKECGVGLFEELVRNILGWKMHLLKECLFISWVGESHCMYCSLEIVNWD